MSGVRVVRLMEYAYPDLEAATKDMAHWQVQGTYSPRAGYTIRSTTLPMEVWPAEEPEPEEEMHSPNYWAADMGIVVMDPEGWRHAGVNYAEPITKEKFDYLLGFSTFRTL